MGEMERWQLAWSAPEVYADYLVPAIFGPWVPVVLGSAQLRQGQSVLDVAYGRGAVATGAAPRVGATGSVTGVDNNRGMLAVAAARSRHRVRWQEADAQLLPFPDGSFDRVICQLGLQYFPDRPAAVREMRRVLRPGGRAVVLVWRDLDHSPGYAALASALEIHAGPQAATVMRAPFVFGDDPAPLVSLHKDAGFADVTVLAVPGVVMFGSVQAFIRYQCAGSPLATQVNLRDEALLTRIADAVAATLAAAVTDEPVEFAIEAHLAHAQRAG